MNQVAIRIDGTLEREARETLGKLGLSLTDAVNLFLRRTVQEQALPFAVGDPDKLTEAELLAKHERGIQQYREGRYVVKTMEELEAMARDE